MVGENNTLKYDKLKDYNFDDEVGALVCGLDLNVNYTKISIASMYL